MRIIIDTVFGHDLSVKSVAHCENVLGKTSSDIVLAKLYFDKSRDVWGGDKFYINMKIKEMKKMIIVFLMIIGLVISTAVACEIAKNIKSE